MPSGRTIPRRLRWLGAELLLTIVGCAGPWATLSFGALHLDLSGTDDPYHGTFVIALAIAAPVLLVAAGGRLPLPPAAVAASSSAALRLRLLASAAGAGATSLVVWDWARIRRAEELAVGWGLYAALAGTALLTLTTAVLAFVDARMDERPPAPELGSMSGPIARSSCARASARPGRDSPARRPRLGWTCGHVRRLSQPRPSRRRRRRAVA